ncbi:MULTISPECIES: glycerate kinase family protein [Paracoccus]|jgi:glycerate kinase|uniref:Glycerate kinase n=1 Tax=Paracoccus denitrificans (strain Pd 1222) TaxID=318586 RepID=A1BAT0_PARDP|nr:MULTISPECIES: glycerate kinase [Paracoccus]ABL72624.1 Glycerate kinase [Paracoccus denitrificans PD1222]MBB4629618.1 glycerate kinase [Paracoccus denitrificans]MCU7431027.1 glycerate kinase [Paracoccus denitrificans]QAR29607.1 glycerate kinase [Paracoccus denitrificans]UPV98623.1 glycerate kinase [Paracoccus denitrificans]
MSLTVLIAPSGFKESLSVKDVAEAIARGVRRAAPHATILTAPMVDGGEGTTEALVAATGGRLMQAEVTGPMGQPVDSFWGLMGGDGPRTAVIEMAAAAGLSLVPRDRRDPTLTTSRGVGELILKALDHGVDRILIGCGDSGINDGGAGMARALGARLLDGEGRELPEGGGALQDLAQIDVSGLDPRLAGVGIDAAVNWHNMLLGPRGVARVFGPQKGASPEQVEQLDRGMTRYAQAIMAATGRDVAPMPGAGASGGLGAGLVAFAGAVLHPRFQIMLDYLDFDRLLGRADLVITAEGALDAQSPFGKVPCEVARRAEAIGIPTVALAGTIGKGARQTYEHGIGAYASIMRRPCSLEKAIGEGAKLLRNAAENTMRMLLVGQRLAARA